MFPARSSFADATAYSAWWYKTIGGGRRQVCSTDGGSLVWDLTTLFRQMRWVWGSPDGIYAPTRLIRVVAGDLPPIMTGVLRPLPVPAALAEELLVSAEAVLRQFGERVTQRWYEGYLRGLRLIPEAQYFPSLRHFTNMPRATAVRALAQDASTYMYELQRYMNLDVEAARGMSRVVREQVVRLGLGQTAYMEELAAMPMLSSLSRAATQRAEQMLAHWSVQALTDMVENSPVAQQIAEAVVARERAAARTAARAAIAAEEAAIARAIASDARAVAAAEGRAIATGLMSLSSLGRLGRFMRGFSAGFALDMPRSAWAFDTTELSTDARWDGVFQSALIAYLRVSLGGAPVFSHDVDENLNRTSSWMRNLSPEWRAVYMQMVDDYNAHRVSITSLYIAAWLRSNVATLDASWRAFVTDPRQVRGFVGLSDIGMPADVVPPPWNRPLASACLICPLQCAEDATNRPMVPTGILPAGTGSLRINDAQIRISLADPPGSGDSSSVLTSAMAKDGATAERSTLWIVGSLAAVAAGGYLVWTGWQRPRARSHNTR